MLGQSVLTYKIPTLGLPEALRYAPLVISGVLGHLVLRSSTSLHCSKGRGKWFRHGTDHPLHQTFFWLPGPRRAGGLRHRAVVAVHHPL